MSRGLNIFLDQYLGDYHTGAMSFLMSLGW